MQPSSPPLRNSTVITHALTSLPNACLQLAAWGNGSHFRLGHGLASDELAPKKVVVLEDVYVTHISCGMNHTLAITNEG